MSTMINNRMTERVNGAISAAALIMPSLVVDDDGMSTDVGSVDEDDEPSFGVVVGSVAPTGVGA